MTPNDTVVIILMSVVAFLIAIVFDMRSQIKNLRDENWRTRKYVDESIKELITLIYKR